MTDVLIIVPKLDELAGVFWVLRNDPTIPTADQTIPGDISFWRFPMGDVHLGIALLAQQTNTYSGALSLQVLNLVNPSQAYLLGTALGHKDKSPLCSVIAAKGIYDICERRPEQGNDLEWVISGPRKSAKLADAVATHLHNNYSDGINRRQFYAELSKLNGMESPDYENEYKSTLDSIEHQLPIIASEYIISGNEYFMTRGDGDDTSLQVWKQGKTCRAYDMESVGFALSAELAGVPWAVFRGISDFGAHGHRANRKFVTAAATKVLIDFLKSGDNRLTEICSDKPKAMGLDIANITGPYVGYMGYLDDYGHLVAYREQMSFEWRGDAAVAQVQSELVKGHVNEKKLDYSVEFRLITSHNVAGTWAENGTSGQHLGSIIGQLGLDSKTIFGEWAGTRRTGIRTGKFVWYSPSAVNWETEEPGSDFETRALEDLARSLDDRSDGHL